jgi:hypothetical protein
MIKALCIVLALVAILAILWMVAVRMPGRSFRGTAPAPDATFEMLRDALRRDVEYLAGPIGERNVIVESAYANAARYIEQSLREAGYATERQTFVAEGYTCTNVIGELRGTSDEIVVLGAHYDTVDESPGADDNASGVAALLALARTFAHRKPRRTIRFVAFANEEPPYFMTEWMGSYQYARRCRQRGEKVVAMLSLESLGYFRDDAGSQKYPAGLEHVFPSTANFIAFASNLGSRGLLRDCIRVFRAHATVPSEGGALPEAVTGIAWSDQWSFWRFGYPAIMVTDTAPFRNPNYHTAWDKPETLDYNRLARVVEGLRRVAEALSSS